MEQTTSKLLNMDYNELNQRYMELQSKPMAKMTIMEREEFQSILELLIKDSKTSEYDLIQYYIPRQRAYEDDIRQIKQYTSEQIAYEEAIIGLAQNRIDKLKSKLERGNDNV
jgi:hypothetical protein